MAIKKIKVGGQVVSNIQEYYGLAKDVANLPVNAKGNKNYITTGSSFFCIDTSDVWMFEEESNQWYKV